MRLTVAELREEQKKTLAMSPIKYGLLAKILFVVMDLFYGRKRSWNKFKVLEIIACVQEARHQQDNEQWHLLLLEERIHRQQIPEMFFLHRIVPQVIAFFYYQISWLLYVIKSSWSYRLNVEFQDHPEREYMLFAREHPELEAEPFESDFKKDYGDLSMMADVIRQIGYDERMHKEESIMKMGMARFA